VVRSLFTSRRCGPAKEKAMRSVTRSSLAAIVLTAAWQFWVPAANAQEPNPPSPGLVQPAPDLSDSKLDAAAAALAQVATVKQDYQQRIEQAAPGDKGRIADEANDALLKAVQDQGLTVDEYNSIIVVAQNDPDVRQKILKRLRPSTE
jgi:Domain of unknown function (DUF4168)